MALHTFGTLASNSLQTALTVSEALADADIGSLNAQISSDKFGRTVVSSSYYTPGPEGIIATGTLAGTVTVTGLTLVQGAPLNAINQALANGYALQVLAQGVPAGTYVSGLSGTTLTLSQAASASGSAYLLIIPVDASFDSGGFGRNFLLTIPGRGVLKCARGDVIAADNIGWPILVTGASVNYPGTIWQFT